MKINFLFACGLVILLAGCFAKKAVVTPAKTAQTESKKDPIEVIVAKPLPVEIIKEVNTTVNSNEKTILQGKALYQTKCNQCHDLKKEKSESERGWRHHVPEMVEMSNNAGKLISKAEQDLILGYLLNAIKA